MKKIQGEIDFGSSYLLRGSRQQGFESSGLECIAKGLFSLDSLILKVRVFGTQKGPTRSPD